ncbi:hypothetical protein ACFC1R_30600 [Kitasatospora sp. NPDC056138]|uniref:hypothetical protein n=1 Tax=Kitasatospora sp. NPDC056138 TaxID=3345724 RepID=UPI0035DA366F
MRGAVTEVALWSGVLVIMTVMLISSVSPVELVVAAVTGVGGALCARRVRLAAQVSVTGWRGACRAVLLLLPFALLRGCSVLLRSLGRRREAPDVWQLVRLHDGTDAGWAGVLTAASPDTCVVDSPSSGELLVHAFHEGGGPLQRALGDSGEVR